MRWLYPRHADPITPVNESPQMYKLGIKRRFWFGYQWHTIVSHETEVMGSGARLILGYPDGVMLAIPNIHKHRLVTYPEYRPKAPPEV